jgi:hypothetical protein
MHGDGAYTISKVSICLQIYFQKSLTFEQILIMKYLHAYIE